MKRSPWLVGVMLTYLGFLLLLPLGALVGTGVQYPWAEFWPVVTAPVALAAYQLTFGTAVTAAVVNTVLGLVLAWVLVRYRFPGRRVLDSLVDLPFAMPSVVAAITLATLYGAGGVLGQFWEEGTALGGFLPLNFTASVGAVVLAQLFVTLPFVVRTVQPVLLELEPEVEEAAYTLGAGDWLCFWRVVFPPLVPALVTGFTLALARGIGEFGVIVIISGNIPYRTLAATVYVYQQLEEFNYPAATAIALVLLLASLVVFAMTNLVQRWVLPPA
ncbi:sulfate transport system permease [Gloeomargarita lithophora Alchichica-D10]|uniref:Sulfate transport system permease protein CysT n=1 Tax=Gloeomargarita lithophora Alchichica-D10 TaxID=1188229 RepID=A0A1J0AAG7_9CYAN|nr:sulfate ABC transporter permease subunit CysT [Gloeomargarita lithophora]APB32901.1 sulfate transport system permease [Gloeomargarita lithophora Alchichica-D10]